MLNEQQKNTLRKLYDKYGSSQENFVQRNTQKTMMATIMKEFSKTYDREEERPDNFNTPIAVVEGPTGVKQKH
tara:strand:+ start:1815 stop:2033 length:219 start_codon:yes stop_codon:yes gene_type:complete